MLPHILLLCGNFLFLVPCDKLTYKYTIRHLCFFCQGRVSCFIWERWMTWIMVRCHSQKLSFLWDVPTALFMPRAEWGYHLVPLGTSHMEPRAELQTTDLWKRVKSREKTGSLHLKTGEKEPICLEMTSPFPAGLVRSAKTSHPLVQKCSLKQRLLSGGRQKKNPHTWLGPGGWRETTS